MSSVIYYATAAVKQWLTDTFGSKCGADLWIKMGYPDEREEAEDRDDLSEFPQGVLSLLNVDIDRQRLHGDNRKKPIGSISQGTIKLQALPIPINIEYQFDIAVTTRKELWCIQEEILTKLYARQSPIITAIDDNDVQTEYLLRPMVNPIDGGDDITAEKYWLNRFRFYIEAWLLNESDVETAYVVLTQKYLINDKQQIIVSQ